MTAWPTVMVTGHRPQHLHPDARSWVQAELRRLACKLRDEHGTTVGISGMAIGADLWWADAVVKAGLQLHAHVPFPQQPTRWQPADRDEWQRLLDRAAHTVTYRTGFGPPGTSQQQEAKLRTRLLHARNDGMIRAGVAAVAVHDPRKTTGGTASAVRKLLLAGRPIIHVDPVARMTTLRRPAQVAA